MITSRSYFAALLLGAASSAYADFAGQPLLGPLAPGSVVNGNTIGAADDNDGFTSGIHIFDIWPGPDDVWQVNWPGGDMNLRLDYSSPADDLDMFLYAPGGLDDSGNYSILSTGVELISEPNAVAGTYYINIDSDTAAHAGPYTLTVFAVPEPSALALLGGLAVAGLRRVRRA